MRPPRFMLLTVAIAGLFLALGQCCHGQAFTATTDGTKIILTPTTPMDMAIVAAGPNTATGKSATILNGKPKLLDWKVLVTFGGQPGPTPPVPPVPPPLQLAGAVIVDETATLKPDESKREREVEAYAKARKLVYRCVDRDVKDQTGKAPPDLQPYLDRAKGKTMPYLILFDTGKPAVVLWEGVLDAGAIVELKKRGQ